MKNEKEYFDRQIMSKILKLDKKHQYRYAMKKPLPNSICLLKQ